MANNTTKKAVFMMGGPASGKSMIRNRMYSDLTILDCDLIKESHKDYDPKAPHLLHDWSAKELAASFYRTIEAGDSFVYDGTGSTAERYVQYIKDAQERGYTVTLCYVRTTITEALKRNAKRERTVPEDIVRDKYALIETSYGIVSPLADKVMVVDN